MIKLLIMDVDGTLTDGKIYLGNNGEEFKAFNVKDGLMIKQLKNYNIEPVILTGRKSKIVEQRAKELDVKYVFQGVDDKVKILNKLANDLKIKLCEMSYIGDDLNDLKCMEIIGLSACPHDAYYKLKEQVDYVCSLKGGEGCVREFIDNIIDLNRKEK